MGLVFACGDSEETFECADELNGYWIVGKVGYGCVVSVDVDGACGEGVCIIVVVVAEDVIAEWCDGVD